MKQLPLMQKSVNERCTQYNVQLSFFRCIVNLFMNSETVFTALKMLC